MHGRIVIPIHNERGELLAYAGRAVNGATPKYRFSLGFKKAEVLFNLNRVLTVAGPRWVILVEGFFDVLKVHQAGFDQVVSLMGSTLSEVQAELLSKHCKAALLFLGGDRLGQSEAAKMAALLVRSLYVKVVHLPNHLQLDRLSTEEIKGFLKST